MAKTEKTYNNELLNKSLKSTTYNGLSVEAKKKLTETIQGCTFLGKYKLPEKDIYYIVRNCPELSLASVEYYLSINRVNNNQNTVHGKSTIEKYKRACILACRALEALIDEGEQIDGLKKVMPSKPLTESQKAHCIELLAKDDISAVELLAYLQSVK